MYVPSDITPFYTECTADFPFGRKDMGKVGVVGGEQPAKVRKAA